ncbi:MAG: helix-turn-helix domain-containing protein [Ruminococcus sp.]|jgi:transcriptional regulator with XRE-family HTH domain|nr:helix-turn-helix domain-containing protein [Ruminococcus sp.]
MNISLANKLSTLRTDTGLSETELSAFINVPEEKIVSWERAESEPTASELFELSKLYHISIDELIKTEEFKSSEPISLKKERPSVSLSNDKNSGYVREKAPDKPAEREIYPKGYKGGGIQFIGADSDRFQDAPYVKAEDIKPRDFSHLGYDEPQGPNINIKTVDDSKTQSSPDFGGLIPPETAAKIGEAIAKAGAVVGTTIDKVTDEIKRSVEQSANANHEEGYTAPPAGYSEPRSGYSPPPPGMSRREQKRWEKEERQREKLQREMDKLQRMADKREKNKHRSLFYKLFPLLMTILFFFVGANINWEWSWLFFLCIPVYYTLVDAIEKRDPRRFAYPVLVLLPYFFLGFVGSPAFFVEGLWLFATVPFYYIIADHVYGKRKQQPLPPKNDEEIYPGNR